MPRCSARSTPRLEPTVVTDCPALDAVSEAFRTDAAADCGKEMLSSADVRLGWGAVVPAAAAVCTDDDAIDDAIEAVASSSAKAWSISCSRSFAAEDATSALVLESARLSAISGSGGPAAGPCGTAGSCEKDARVETACRGERANRSARSRSSSPSPLAFLPPSLTPSPSPSSPPSSLGLSSSQTRFVSGSSCVTPRLISLTQPSTPRYCTCSRATLELFTRRWKA
mmetsp:Transcript_8310/g.23759  ORF Transcript_8310/g.23759 Transcript_8310/m.23759 type:complete len:226 (-) Transcript_8310:9332-10009(-)